MTYGSPQTPDSNITLTVNDLNTVEREEITLFASRNGSEIANQTDIGFHWDLCGGSPQIRGY